MSNAAKKLIGALIVTAMVITGLLMAKVFDNSESTNKLTANWGSSQKLQNWLAQSGVSTTTELNNLSKKLFTKKYDATNISFRYPEGFKVGEFPSGAKTKVIVVQHPQKQIGVQVVITSLDKPINLTEQLIEKELPDYPVNNPQPVKIAGKKKGLVFTSNNKAFGHSREIWFTYKQNLYQITSYQSLDPFVKTFFKTWKFK